MTDKILLVDDDLNLLAAMQRNLRRRFQLDTASGGAAALELMTHHGPYAVVVADLGMPGMNGAQFLTLCQERFPDTVRIMFTGDAEQEEAVEAIDRAQLFRTLSKPCPAETLIGSLEAALAQHRLIVAQREQM